MSKPRFFQDFPTKAHNVEVMPASHHINSFYPTESKKDKVKFKNNVKFSKNTTKEVMSTSISQLIRITGKLKLEDKKSLVFKDGTKKRLTLKELQQKKYPFLDSVLSRMLDDLLQNEVIELSESKCLEEARRIIDPKYCQYHRVISHPLEKCIMLKEPIMQLARDRKIISNLDDTFETNHIFTQLK